MKIKKGSLLIFMGLLLIAAALFLASFNLYDDQRATQSVKQVIGQLEAHIPTTSGEASAQASEPPEEFPDEPPAAESGETEIPNYILNPNMEMPVQDIDGNDYIGILEIPALDLRLPIISEWNYSNLRTAPCRYKGSAYLGNLIIAAHNYSSHFGTLKALTPGDTVTFTDVEGNVFIYKVAVLEVLEPTAIKEMESGGWELTLFTCTVGGQSRVAVRCLREGN